MLYTIVSLIFLAGTTAANNDCHNLCVRELGNEPCGFGSYEKENGLCHRLFWTSAAKVAFCVFPITGCVDQFPVSAVEAHERMTATPTTVLTRTVFTPVVTGVTLVESSASADDPNVGVVTSTSVPVATTIGRCVRNASRMQRSSFPAGTVCFETLPSGESCECASGACSSNHAGLEGNHGEPDDHSSCDGNGHEERRDLEQDLEQEGHANDDEDHDGSEHHHHDDSAENVDSLIVDNALEAVLDLVDIYTSLDTFTGQGYTNGGI